MQTALYRHWDKDDRLMYVGISLSVFKRLSDHQRTSDWASRIVRVTIEQFPTREDALDAERTAIQFEHPECNVVHNGAVRRGLQLNSVKPARRMIEEPYLVAADRITDGQEVAEYSAYDLALDLDEAGWAACEAKLVHWDLDEIVERWQRGFRSSIDYIADEMLPDPDVCFLGHNPLYNFYCDESDLWQTYHIGASVTTRQEPEHGMFVYADVFFRKPKIRRALAKLVDLDVAVEEWHDPTTHTGCAFYYWNGREYTDKCGRAYGIDPFEE
jgi:hypothetical protein